MINNEQRIGRAVGAGFYLARAVKYHKFDRTDANPHAPVGADASVRPAARTRKIECTVANTHAVCRGRCPHRPAWGTPDLTKRCGKTVIAQRADRVVRPYGCMPFRIGVCGFAIVPRAGGTSPLRYDEIRKNRILYYIRFCADIQLFLEQKFPLLFPGGGSCIME